MTHLRLPSVHHLGSGPWSLKHFAIKHRGREPGIFVRPYNRPSPERFDARCDRIVETFSLFDLHVADRVVGAKVDELIASASLPYADCGYPIMNSALRWPPRL